MKIIDGNSQEYVEIQMLGTLAQVVIADPKGTAAWVEMSINPHPPVPKGSAEFEKGCKLFLKINGNSKLSDILDYALYLQKLSWDMARHVSHSLRWAVQNKLIEFSRERRLTEQEQDMWDKIQRSI